MLDRSTLKAEIYNVNSESYDDIALNLFQYQYVRNAVYRRWVDLLGVDPDFVNKVSDIPFLPIETFKTFEVVCDNVSTEHIFRSSGTQGQMRSQHFVAEMDIYHHSVKKNFERLYGNLNSKVWLALLPSYMERDDASLIEMTRYFMNQSDYSEDCGFYLHHSTELTDKIQQLKQERKEVFLIGVTFALLDWMEDSAISLPDNVTVIETGGMKGRRRELIREELHRKLKRGFQTENIHSEYGMTELFSQAYSEDGVFIPAKGMKVFPRSITDPLSVTDFGNQAALNIIDLYNIDSCAFIATDDIGRVYKNGTFEVLGRLDNSEIRGCNLMVY